MARRDFLKRATALAGFAACAHWSPAASAQPAPGNLRDRAERLHQILEEQFYDPQGLMFAYINIETRKPFTAEEVAGYPINFPGQPSVEDWFCYENTPVVAGNYLSALGQRARVEPGAKVNAMIERALGCLRKVYEMSAAFKEPGWLCKPYGGKPSNEATNDQYGGAIGGLRDLARLSGHSLAGEARRLAVSRCDFGIRNDYTIPAFGRPKSRWMAQKWGLVSMAFVRVAYELTGEAKYAQETERLCREVKCDQPATRAGNFHPNPFPDRPQIGVRRFAAYHYLVAEYLDALCEGWPERRAHWEQLMTEFWNKDINMGVDEDGLIFACHEVNKETNQWKPIAAQYLFPTGLTRETAPFPAQHWVGRFKSGSMTCHVASSAVKVGHRVKELREPCRQIALKVLHKVDEDQMATWIDPSGDQMPPGESMGPIRKKMFDGRAPAQWLRAYWEGCDLGWWK